MAGMSQDSLDLTRRRLEDSLAIKRDMLESECVSQATAVAAAVIGGLAAGGVRLGGPGVPGSHPEVPGGGGGPGGTRGPPGRARRHGQPRPADDRGDRLLPDREATRPLTQPESHVCMYRCPCS